MLKSRLLACILGLILPCSALITNEIHIKNHGGYPLLANIGADPGDVIELDVTCDHAVNGYCFVAPPSIKNGPNFELVDNEPDHQAYRLIVNTLGDHIITANYWWVGYDVHYAIDIYSKARA